MDGNGQSGETAHLEADQEAGADRHSMGEIVEAVGQKVQIPSGADGSWLGWRWVGLFIG